MNVKAIIVEFAGGERRELSIDEARELFRQLEKLFGRQEPKVTIDGKTGWVSGWPTWVKPQETPQPLWYSSTGQPGAVPTVWCRTDP